MIFHPLDGAFERVKRAEEHLTDLRTLIIDIIQEQQNATIAYFKQSAWQNEISGRINMIAPWVSESEWERFAITSELPLIIWFLKW